MELVLNYVSIYSLYQKGDSNRCSRKFFIRTVIQKWDYYCLVFIEKYYVCTYNYNIIQRVYNYCLRFKVQKREEEVAKYLLLSFLDFSSSSSSFSLDVTSPSSYFDLLRFSASATSWNTVGCLRLLMVILPRGLGFSERAKKKYNEKQNFDDRLKLTTCEQTLMGILWFSLGCVSNGRC